MWLDWRNGRRFVPSRIMPLLETYSAYRARFPETVQVVLNHADACRRPAVLPYWRPGDPVLFRTPPYDRDELAPIPPGTIWAYEGVLGAPYGSEPLPAGSRRRRARRLAKDAVAIRSNLWLHRRTASVGTLRQLVRGLRRPHVPTTRRWAAGFVGQPSGPRRYRERVAEKTADPLDRIAAFLEMAVNGGHTRSVLTPTSASR